MEDAWIGVDLDGTLAHYDGWKGVQHVGAPVPLMLARVKEWLAGGRQVRIFTARVSPNQDREKLAQARYWIEKWCMEHVGHALPVTCEKDFSMLELWDDRAVRVEFNTGKVI